MPADRRETDKIILDELRNLQKDVSRIDVNLALNTQETARLAKYQETQNGRVAGHEARMQVVEGAQALTATSLAKMQSEKDKEQAKQEESTEKQSDRLYESHNRWKWVVVGLAISLGSQILLYLIKGDILKNIFS
jgi:sorbitol-specific phosphotransferase system component IIBC